MKPSYFLIDTQVFLWLAMDDKRISKKARTILESKDSQIMLSAASIWEMAIKSSLGKLVLNVPFNDFIKKSLKAGFIGVLDIDRHHVSSVAALPHHHNDPFDRLLVAQAQIENVSLMSSDKLLRKYDIEIIW